MAKVQSDFELNITGNIKKALEEIGFTSDKADKIINKLSKSVKDGFDEQDTSIKKVVAQLKVNEEALKNLTSEEQKNSELGKTLISQRKDFLITLEKDKQMKKDLIKEAQLVVKAEMDTAEAQEINANSILAVKLATRDLVKERERLDFSTQDGIQRFKEITDEIELNEVKLKSWDEQIGRNQRNVGNYNGAVDKLKPALREIREKLEQMSLAGKENTDEFLRLQMQAAKYKDTIGDVSGRIRVLADDMFVFNSIGDGIKGVASGFQIVQGAMALLGGESEDLKKVMEKVVIAQTVVNGVTELGNILQAESAFRTGISVVVTKAKAVATWIQITAEKALNITMGTTAALTTLITGGLVLLIPLVMGIGKWFSSSAEKSEKYNKQLEEMKKNQDALAQSGENIISFKEHELELLKAKGGSIDEIEKKEKELAIERLKVAKSNEEEAIRNLELNNKALDGVEELSDEQKKGVEDLTKARLDAEKKVIESARKLELLEVTQATNRKKRDEEGKKRVTEKPKISKEDNNALEEQKKANEEYKKQVEELNAFLQEQEQDSLDFQKQKIDEELALNEEKNNKIFEAEIEQLDKLRELRDKYGMAKEEQIDNEWIKEVEFLTEQYEKKAISQEEFQTLMFESETAHKQALTDLEQQRIDAFIENWQKSHEFATGVINSLTAGYDSFVSTLTNSEMTGKERREKIWDSMKASFISFLGDMLKQQITNLVVREAIAKTAEGTALASAIVTGQGIASAYATAAALASVATFGASAVAGTVGLTSAVTTANALSLLKFEQGGLLPNKRNVILTNDGNKSNFQEYIINGDKTKKYKNELDVINFGSENQVNNLFNGANVSAPAQINTSGTYARGGIVTASYSDNSLLKAVQSLQATTNLNTGYIASQTSQIRDLNNKMALASGKDVALIVKSGNQKLNTVR